MKQIFLSSIFIFTSLFLYSQEHDHHDHHHHEYEHHKTEIGFSNNTVFNTHENEFAYGLHLYFVRTIGKTDKFGLGFSYERIFDDHKHNSTNLLFAYRLGYHLSINFAPGIVWLDSEANSIKPSFHLETIYEWELEHFCLGPLLGIAFNADDFHASIGMHLAVGL